MLQLCVYIYVSIYMYILFQIIFHCGLFENIEYSSICYKLLKFLIEFEILLIRFGIQWIILLLLSSSLGMPPYSFLASIVFAKKLTHNVVNNLFVVSSLSPFDFRVLSLSFDSLIIMCLNVDIVVFILLGVHYISNLCKIISSIKLGSFQPLYHHILCHFFLSHWDS